jgi:cell division protein FtsB
VGAQELRMDIKKGLPEFLEEHGRVILGLFVLALMVHDVFGAHGFIAMRRTQNEIERVRKDIDRLNSENMELGEQVKALKSDPHLIEKIAREELYRGKPGEVIIRIPQSPPGIPSQSPAVKP